MLIGTWKAVPSKTPTSVRLDAELWSLEHWYATSTARFDPANKVKLLCPWTLVVNEVAPAGMLGAGAAFANCAEPRQKSAAEIVGKTTLLLLWNDESAMLIPLG